MKKLFTLFGFVPALALLAGTASFVKSYQKNEIKGAWYTINNGTEQVLLFQDGYFTHTIYSKADKNFVATSGGPFALADNTITVTKEFDTADKASIGSNQTYSYKTKAGDMDLTINGQKLHFKRLDDGSDKLADTWKITGRKQDGTIIQIHQTGARKTLKILSGTRFQWAAINAETKEFFGTGGGTYSFDNGTYTENIEFFSRDNSRVGASLSFEGKLVGDDWHHSGKSSRGGAIYEVWSRITE